MARFKHRKRIILAAVAWLFSGLLGAQPVEWKASLDSTKITVGDPLRLHLEAKQFTSEEAVIWPELQGKLGTLEVLEATEIDTLAHEGGVRYAQEIWITGFDSGLFFIPSLPLKVQGAGSASYTVVSDSLPVHVTIMDADTSAVFRDIKDIMPAPFPWMNAAIAVGIILLLALLAYWIYRQLKNRKPKAAPAAPSIPLHEQTLALLDHLEARQLWQKGETKAYYVALTDILRTYLEKRFQMAAMELTTEELLHSMTNHKELAAHRDHLAPVLQHADLAKFARASLNPEDHHRSMDRVRNFVQSTPEVIIERPRPSS